VNSSFCIRTLPGPNSTSTGLPLLALDDSLSSGLLQRWQGHHACRRRRGGGRGGGMEVEGQRPGIPGQDVQEKLLSLRVEPSRTSLLGRQMAEGRNAGKHLQRGQLPLTSQGALPGWRASLQASSALHSNHSNSSGLAWSEKVGRVEDPVGAPSN